MPVPLKRTHICIHTYIATLETQAEYVNIYIFVRRKSISSILLHKKILLFSICHHISCDAGCICVYVSRFVCNIIYSVLLLWNEITAYLSEYLLSSIREEY